MRVLDGSNVKFECGNCHNTVLVPRASVVDTTNPELNLAMEGWFVLFHPQDWISRWDGQGFCSFDCLSSWVNAKKSQVLPVTSK